MTALSASAGSATGRVVAGGKFLYQGKDKFFVRGATYGTFAPNLDGEPYPSPSVVARDFEDIRARGLNAVRTYTPPPRWLLDIAHEHSLVVLAGFAWEEHVALLSERQRASAIEERLRAAVRDRAGHPAVLGWTVGNEIPTAVVRWHGARKVERFLERLAATAKDEDPDGLVTYVNYPPTEYLDLSFVDFACFNVYLEDRDALLSYLARLQNVATDRPLVMAEIGLDSRRNGLDVQADVLDWQVRTTFDAGCAGAFVFSWTDDWHTGGEPIEDWDFGLTDRDRSPKPALERVELAFSDLPGGPPRRWPRISVVVCSYNGARTLSGCLDGVRQLEYPEFEVIVVDDGSSDATAQIAAGYGVRVISTENRGLSSARNTGMEAAAGEIVAYLDDDACPDRDWLTYLAMGFGDGRHVAVGGPNLPPAADDVLVAGLAMAPGSPAPVLISDSEAEHLPGCNLAVRKDALEMVGGFDERFRVAGDDVDVCWRLRDRGLSLGYSHAAMVWHHRRRTWWDYLRQQRGYGQAEALLALKWASRYNASGHATWVGRVYGGCLPAVFRRGRPAYGTWGSHLFQPMYEFSPGLISSLPLMPEWYLLITLLAVVAVGGIWWSPLVASAGLAGGMVCYSVLYAGLSASRGRLGAAPQATGFRVAMRAIVALAFLLQPLARLRGRLSHGLAPWRRRPLGRTGVPRPRNLASWSECWQDPHDRLVTFERALSEHGAVTSRGGVHDRWDLAIRGGLLGGALVRTLVEEHGQGRQLVRARLWPRWSPLVLGALIVIGLAGEQAVSARRWPAAALLIVLAVVLAGRAAQESGAAVAVASESFARSVGAYDPAASVEPVTGASPVTDPERRADTPPEGGVSDALAPEVEVA